MSVKDIKTYVDLCLEGDSTIHERYEIILKQKPLLWLSWRKRNEESNIWKTKQITTLILLIM